MESLPSKTGALFNVFPNIYQHKIQPFEVQDPIRPGLAENRAEVAGLPLEVGQMIVGLLNRSKLMDVEEAKEHREELMEERKFFVKMTNDEVFARPFSLCEH
ncbi:hypothetical protein BGZ47_002737 [Haplosporangium gracile]|nr:hypothetical protein BGZ47_002737 [Haplosporangium gracile]